MQENGNYSPIPLNILTVFYRTDMVYQNICHWGLRIGKKEKKQGTLFFIDFVQRMELKASFVNKIE